MHIAARIAPPCLTFSKMAEMAAARNRRRRFLKFK
jgi:hypothetical protein